MEPQKVNILVRAAVFVVMVMVVSPGLPKQKKGSAAHAQGARDEDISRIYDKVLPALRQKSSVPPLLPSVVPYLDSSTYVILLSAGPNTYRIILGAEPDCQGQHFCSYGSLEGSKTPIELGKGRGIPVALRRGTAARYFPTRCTVYCDEAYITWKNNGYFYAIGLKAGSKQDLMRATNSVFAPR